MLYHFETHEIQVFLHFIMPIVINRILLQICLASIKTIAWPKSFLMINVNKNMDIIFRSRRKRRICLAETTAQATKNASCCFWRRIYCLVTTYITFFRKFMDIISFFADISWDLNNFSSWRVLLFVWAFTQSACHTFIDLIVYIFVILQNNRQ